MVATLHSLRPAIPLEQVRVRQVVEQHLDFVWRTLRRLGVPDADLEDETQKVFLVTAQKLETIEPGRERSFVFGTAVRVASHARRSHHRRREEAIEETFEPIDPLADPEQRASQNQALERLAEILDAMTEDLRRTFVLYELEQLTLAEIAAIEQLPLGTVASRLRRARATFQTQVERLQFVNGGRTDARP